MRNLQILAQHRDSVPLAEVATQLQSGGDA